MAQSKHQTLSVPTGHYINNKYVDGTSSERIHLVSPYDGSPLAQQVHVAGQEDIDAAVSAATAAYTGGWGVSNPAQRRECMNRFADLVEQHAERLAILESLPTGRPITPTMKFDIANMAQVYRYYAGWVDKIGGESYPDDNGFYKVVRYEPLGVCAGIASWNATFLYIGWKIAPAVAAGNCFIFKPSEKSPFGALALGELFAEAGFPKGVVQIVNGAQSTGALLAAHRHIAKISFTGSIDGGKAVQELALKSNMKRVTLELGGKSPAMVFDDVALDRAVQGVAGFLANSGQICVATSRVLVQKSIVNEFCAALAKAFKGAEAGMGCNPLDPSTMLGPIVDQRQFERVMSYIAIGKKTATLVTGGEQKGDKGFFVKPTIFLNPDPKSPIVKEEIFGPVLTIQTFETEDEAIRMANATQYGLAASIYTADVDRAFRVSSQLQCGGVAINSPYLPELNTPFGGTKASGQGRELGKHGLLAYMEPKSIHIKINRQSRI